MLLSKTRLIASFLAMSTSQTHHNILRPNARQSSLLMLIIRASIASQQRRSSQITADQRYPHTPSMQNNLVIILVSLPCLDIVRQIF